VTPNGQLGGYLAQILAGFNWLLQTAFDGADEEPGVDVMNASLGGGTYNNFYYSTLAKARMTTGTVLAAAIGNAGPSEDRHGSPGNYDIAVGVGAVDAQNDVANFSDWGTVAEHNGLAKPDICAPGVDVWSSVPGGQYASMRGTSMATPVVAGVLALLLQEEPELMLDAGGLIDKLYGMAVPHTSASNKKRGGRGRVSF
jgi:subtilisin family serine protease